MRFRIDQEIQRNGFVRKVLDIGEHSIYVRTIGVPVSGLGEIPESGMIDIDLFRKWVKEKGNKGPQLVQLLI